jgi:Rod binding domain-containing protein
MEGSLFSSAAALPPQLPPSAPPSGRGAKAAREFEAQLIGSLMTSLEKTFSAVPGQDPSVGSVGSDDYDYLATHALAEVVASEGGFGIAAMISRYLAAHESKG